jgi:hypothetical protein
MDFCDGVVERGTFFGGGPDMGRGASSLDEEASICITFFA